MMHQTALNGKLTPQEVILVAGSFYFRGICIWQMREAVPRQPAPVPGVLEAGCYSQST